MISWTLLALSKNTKTCFETMYMELISYFWKIYISLLQKILSVFTEKKALV